MSGVNNGALSIRDAITVNKTLTEFNYGDERPQDVTFYKGGGAVRLDGDFTMLDLSAILTAMRRMQEVHHD